MTPFQDPSLCRTAIATDVCLGADMWSKSILLSFFPHNFQNISSMLNGSTCEWLAVPVGPPLSLSSLWNLWNPKSKAEGPESDEYYIIHANIELEKDRRGALQSPR